MSRLQYNENRSTKETFSVELTRGQLITLICFCLVMAIGLFSAGILIGKLDPSLTADTAAAPESKGEETAVVQEMETYTTPAVGNPKEEPSPTKTASTSEKPPKAERTPETPPPRNPYMDNAPRLTALPPLTPYRSFPVQAEAPTRIPTPAAPPATTAQAQSTAVPAPPATTAPVQTAAAPAAPAGPQLTPIDPLEPPIIDAPVTPQPAAPQPATAAAAPDRAPVAAQPASAPPATPAKVPEAAPAASSPGKFGVQLAAFSGGDRRVRAESFLKKVRDEFKLDATIIPSSDDVHYRVISGSYSTKEAAATACDELKRKTGLNEAFVRPL